MKVRHILLLPRTPLCLEYKFKNTEKTEEMNEEFKNKETKKFICQKICDSYIIA